MRSNRLCGELPDPLPKSYPIDLFNQTFNCSVLPPGYSSSNAMCDPTAGVCATLTSSATATTSMSASPSQTPTGSETSASVSESRSASASFSSSRSSSCSVTPSVNSPHQALHLSAPAQLLRQHPLQVTVKAHRALRVLVEVYQQLLLPAQAPLSQQPLLRVDQTPLRTAEANPIQLRPH